MEMRNLAYYRIGARYYDSDLGMWISADPARQFPSPYEYGGNNPIGHVDPDGRADDPFQTMTQLFMNQLGITNNQINIDNHVVSQQLNTASSVTSYAALGADVSAVVDPELASKAVLAGAGVTLSITSVGLSWGSWLADPSLKGFQSALLNTLFAGLGYGAGKIASTTEAQILNNGNQIFRNTDTGRFVSALDAADDMTKGAAASTAADVSGLVTGQLTGGQTTCDE